MEVSYCRPRYLITGSGWRLGFLGGTDGNFYAIDRESGTLKWKFEAKSRITSYPAVSGCLAYFDAYDGNLYALDAATGQLK
jgi:eukaryotic-like serine/threonine-protein kinase